MIEYFIGAILIIITILVIMLIFRKRVYDRVDNLEAWKIDIMNRNVTSELAKIKVLNLSGETQEKFEKWRRRWENIVATDLSDIEEALFDAEEAADRFRFPKANKTLNALEETLEKVEDDIDEILRELDVLLQAEKKSKTQLEEVTEEIDKLRIYIQDNRHQIGQADRYCENVLREAENALLEYYDLVENGNYTQAQEHVQTVHSNVQDLKETIEQLPAIYQKCNYDLPSELKQLLLGIDEMVSDGFRVEQFQFEEEVGEHEESLKQCISALENGEVDKVKEMAQEIEERIGEIYDTLEEEALAKNYVESQINSYREQIKHLSNEFTKTKEEVEQLKATYFFDDQNMEQFLVLEKEITQIGNEAHELVSLIADENKTHITLRSRLEIQEEQLKQLIDRHDEFIENMNRLRKDELESREILETLQAKLHETERKLQTSNLPGVPEFIWERVETSYKDITKVNEALEYQPLDISQVQHALNHAEKTIEQLEEEAQLVIEQCYLTEQVIQYANRYRSQYPLLSAQLSEAERLFREYEYELALEEAARAIEEIEPGALHRIEENQKYMESM